VSQSLLTLKFPRGRPEQAWTPSWNGPWVRCRVQVVSPPSAQPAPLYSALCTLGARSGLKRSLHDVGIRRWLIFPLLQAQCTVQAPVHSAHQAPVHSAHQSPEVTGWHPPQSNVTLKLTQQLHRCLYICGPHSAEWSREEACSELMGRHGSPHKYLAPFSGRVLPGLKRVTAAYQGRRPAPRAGDGTLVVFCLGRLGTPAHLLTCHPGSEKISFVREPRFSNSKLSAKLRNQIVAYSRPNSVYIYFIVILTPSFKVNKLTPSPESHHLDMGGHRIVCAGQTFCH
jgi:hypothetical protein